MTDKSRSYVALGCTVLCVTVSQVLLKFAGQHAAGQESGLLGVAKNPWLWASLFFSGVGLVYWLKTLRHLPLSSAYPWTALIYVLMPLASAFLFHDPIGLKYTAGMVFIVAGVYLTATSQGMP